MKTLLLLVTLTLVAVFIGCSNNAAESPLVSVAEATAVLNQAVAYAQAHDLNGLGALADDPLMTQTILENMGGWKTLPTEPPSIVDTYLVADVHYEGYTALGGRVLVLEGVDGLGQSYRTEFLVYWYDGKLAVINVIYWSGSGIIT